MGKSELRAHMRCLRNATPPHVRTRTDEQITRLVVGLGEFVEADLVLTYLSVGSEVQTRRIIERAWDAGKTVAIPRCVPDTRTMTWHVIQDFEGLCRGPFGVEEPVPQTHPQVTRSGGERAIALVPGLAFDRHGYRIGYGGGYYDTFLRTFDGTSVGLCRADLVVDDLRALGALEPHDLPVTFVVAG